MKKTIYFLMLSIFCFGMVCMTPVHAAELTTINVTTSSETIHPENDVTVTIDFGTPLGSYTFDIAYDNNLFTYVSSEGGTANDTGTKVRVYYFDQQGGTNPRNSMSITFRAKAGITTSNPTDFAITAEGLANPDASVTYDDITTPIIKNVVVEPDYQDYTIDLAYTGSIVKNEPKDMSISITSNMGRYYDHARLVARATTPTGATAQLLAIDSQNVEHDILDSGWGDASGFAIGGDVNQVIQAQGIFSQAGEYTIVFDLIDRDDSDAVIATTTETITVTDTTITPPAEEDDNDDTNTNTTIPTQPTTPGNSGGVAQPEPETTPTTLPKTGTTAYLFALPIILALGGIAFVTRKKS